MRSTDDGLAPARVVLVGMMGSGKSSVGLALAAHTGWPFVDSDALVEQGTGSTARELLERSGVTELRRAEAEALSVGLALPPPVIVAAAAGTVLDIANRRAIADAGLVVWLQAPTPVLVRRAVGADHRPWLEDNPEAWFAAAIEERAPLYAEVADLELDTEAIDADRAVALILDAIGHR